MNKKLHARKNNDYKGGKKNYMRGTNNDYKGGTKNYMRGTNNDYKGGTKNYMRGTNRDYRENKDLGRGTNQYDMWKQNI
jgi:hypothetical protein